MPRHGSGVARTLRRLVQGIREPAAARPRGGLRDLTKQIANLLTVRFHPAIIRAGGRVHLVLFRLFGGAGLLGADTLVLTTRGRRSGRARSTPLYYLERDGAYFVAAGFAGSPTPPYWFTNLAADPSVIVQIGARRIPCSARVLPEVEARPIWSALVALYPPFERYQARTRRRIPVIRLQPMAGSPPPSGEQAIS